MRKWFGVFGVLFAALALAVVSTAAANDEHGDGQHGQGNGTTFGPYNSTSPDSGTCGNDWANDTFQRVFTVNRQNADGTYTVREDFRNGSFVTLPTVFSPGSCDTNPGGTVLPLIKGSMGGFEFITVTGGTLNRSATCPAVCTTAGFIAAAFGPSATYTVGSFAFGYVSFDSTLCKHVWRNASADFGGNAGDIANCPLT